MIFLFVTIKQIIPYRLSRLIIWRPFDDNNGYEALNTFSGNLPVSENILSRDIPRRLNKFKKTLDKSGEWSYIKRMADNGQIKQRKIKMKKLIVMLMLVGLVACKKPSSVSTGVDSSVVDSVKVDSVKTDSAK